MEETYNELMELIKGTEDDAGKFFDKTNKAAGKRLRKSLMDVKKLAHQLRGEITDEIKSI